MDKQEDKEMRKPRRYGRFYALLGRLRGAEKEELALQYSDGRTTHLREMSDEEIAMMERAMERSVREAEAVELRRARSRVLRLMQRIGVDTSDWLMVDAFCQQRRISGKLFRYLSLQELKALERKLHAIERRGGLRHRKESAPSMEGMLICVGVGEGGGALC